MAIQSACLDRKIARVTLDEEIPDKTRVWFAELASGEIHTQGHAKYFNCLVLLQISGKSGVDGSKFKRVGYSFWDESYWYSEGFPELRKVRICLI